MKPKHKTIFSKYEERFRTAIDSDFVRNIGSRDFKELIDTYREASGVSLDSNPGCGACVLRAFKVIGRWYFEQINQINSKRNVK